MERELNFWNEEVREFLEIRLNTFILDNIYLNDFNKVNQADWGAFIKKIGGEKVDVIHSK
mgnify:CR=1 FL=1